MIQASTSLRFRKIVPIGGEYGLRFLPRSVSGIRLTSFSAYLRGEKKFTVPSSIPPPPPAVSLSSEHRAAPPPLPPRRGGSLADGSGRLRRRSATGGTQAAGSCCPPLRFLPPLSNGELRGPTPAAGGGPPHRRLCRRQPRPVPLPPGSSTCNNSSSAYIVSQHSIHARSVLIRAQIQSSSRGGWKGRFCSPMVDLLLLNVFDFFCSK